MVLFARLLFVVAAALLPLTSWAETPQRIKGVYDRAEADVLAKRYGRASARLQWLLLHDTASTKRTLAYQTALHRIKRKQPLSFGASASLMPSSNISKTFDGTEKLHSANGDARPGIGLRFGGFAQAIESYAPGREVIARLDLGRSVYDDTRLNSQALNFSLAHKWLNAGTTYGLAGFANRTRFQPVDDIETSDVDRSGVRFSVQRVLTNGHSVNGIASIEASHYINSDYLDGQRSTILGVYSIPLSPTETLNFTGGIERAKVMKTSYSYRSVILGTRYTRTMPNGLTWNMGATHTRRHYEALFPVETPVMRADKVTDISIGLSHRALKVGETIPRLTCTSRSHRSNVYLYDYSSIDCSIKLQFDF
jgi:hypothetical protein